MENDRKLESSLGQFSVNHIKYIKYSYPTLCNCFPPMLLLYFNNNNNNIIINTAIFLSIIIIYKINNINK